MAGGRKGRHKGKSHQMENKTYSESNEDTTCGALVTGLFLAAPSNPAKRSIIEDTDEFNPEETQKFLFDAEMWKNAVRYNG